MSGGLKARPQAYLQNAMPCPYNYRATSHELLQIALTSRLCKIHSA
jgi:hypothetical protein